jgi:PST family polysaccharide transporter
MPRDFGLVAMVAVVVSFIALFRDIGLTQAVVQHSNLSRAQVDALFWVNVLITTGLGLATALAAPLVARAYEEPALLAITYAFSGFFMISGLGALHQAVLARRMEFSKIVSAELSGQIAGVALAIVIAVAGGGYWALVAMPGTRAIVATAILWLVCPWHPGWPRRGAEVKDLLKFGGNVTGFNTANFFSRNADNALIGWRWGATSLGLYERAYAMLLLPIVAVNAPLSRVAIPTLARLKAQPDRYRDAYLRVVRLSCLLLAPAMAYGAVASDWLVFLVLGPGWEGVSTIIMFLAILGVVQPLTNTTSWLFITQERSAELFQWGIVSSIVTVASFVIGLRLGPVGVAASYALTGLFLRAPLLLFWVGRRGPVSTADLYRVLALPLSLSIWVAGAGGALRVLGPPLTPWAGLGILGVLAIVGAIAVFAVPPAGRRAWRECWCLLQDLRPTSNTTPSELP